MTMMKADAPSSHHPGVAYGIVTKNEDDQHLGRVKVRFPWISDQHESDWAPVASLSAGAADAGRRGILFLPEVVRTAVEAKRPGALRYSAPGRFLRWATSAPRTSGFDRGSLPP